MNKSPPTSGGANTQLTPHLGKTQQRMSEDISETRAILPLRNTVLFPKSLETVQIGRPRSVRLLQEALEEKTQIVVLLQKDPAIDNPKEEDQIGRAHV